MFLPLLTAFCESHNLIFQRTRWNSQAVETNVQPTLEEAWPANGKVKHTCAFLFEERE